MNEMTTIDRTQREYSAAAKEFLARKPQLFINGEWVASSHDKVIEVEDPSNGQIVSHVVDASDKDVDRAVAAARAALDDDRWSGLPPMVRERMMHKLADLLGTRCRPVRRAGSDRQWQAQGHGRRGRYSGRDQPDPLTWPAGPARSAAR